jgi:hypothetical protein
VALIYAEEYSVKLQERLDEPTIWKDIFKVLITNEKVLHNPYKTDASVAVLTPYSAYSPQTLVHTDDSISIDTHAVVPEIIDRADLAQCTYAKQMDIAAGQGQLLNEEVEAKAFAQYGQMTTFDNTEIGGAAGNITVSSSNIDDIIRAVKREIRAHKGGKLLKRNGGFIVWRPEDFELLEGFVQANGFSSADDALKNGVDDGITYMGMTHYPSNLLTAGHLIAGVKKVATLGICQDTYGQIMVNEKDPGNVSGVSIVSRIDWKLEVWAVIKPLMYNVTVA